MIPKIGNRDELDAYIKILPTDKPLEIQIESCRSVINLKEIASHPKVESLSFGPLDFLADLGAPVFSAREWSKEIRNLLTHTLSQIIVAGHAYDKYVYDGPTTILEDEYLIQDTQLAFNLGADGKWLIHPSQIEKFQEIFLNADEKLLDEKEFTQGSIKRNSEMFDAASLRISDNRK